MNLSKFVQGAAATGGLAIAACAICCAPLVAAPVLGVLAAGGIGLAFAGQIGIAVVLAIGVAAYVWRRRQRRMQTVANTCGCGPTSSCVTDDKPARS